jgi:hypothetical protein
VDLSKLDRTRRALAVIGLLAIIDSFLQWGHLSVNGHDYNDYGGNAWDMGFGSWFPMVLLFALGVVAVLPAFGVYFDLPLGLSLISALVGALSTIIVLLRWVTLPSYFGASVAASYGLYIGLLLSIAAAVFGWLGYTAEGGNFKTVGDAFKQRQAGPPPGQG